MLQQNLYQSNIELIFRKLKGETINHKVLHDKTRKLVNTKTYSLQCLSMDKFTCIHPHYLMYGDKIIPYLNQRDLLINECYSREGNLHKTIAILQKFFWWQTLKEDVYMNYTYSGHNIPRRLLIENQNVWIYNLRSSRLTSSIQILEVQNQMENYSAGQFLSEGSIVQGGKDYSFVYTDGKTMQISNKLLFPQISIVTEILFSGCLKPITQESIKNNISNQQKKKQIQPDNGSVRRQQIKASMN